jgi:hypothetical protein
MPFGTHADIGIAQMSEVGCCFLWNRLAAALPHSFPELNVIEMLGSVIE